MKFAIVLFVVVIGTAVDAQEWAFPPVSSNVNQFDSARTPIRHMASIESSPTFWNMQLAPTTGNEYVHPSAMNNYGHASNQASPLYNGVASAHRPISDTCCTSSTAEQMAKDIADVLNVLHAIAVSIDKLNANLSRTIPTPNFVSADKVADYDAANIAATAAEKSATPDVPTTASENIPFEKST